MRVVSVVLVLWLVGAVIADDKDAKAISPAEAAKKVNEKCIVQMEVKSVGKVRDVLFLNSKEDYKDKDNFSIFINKEGMENLKEAKIDDPVAHFKGKVIRVTGTVKLFRERPEIVVEKADQIKVVEKK
jgi:DNA/RNA endonuclease YhcR with UshA esterase domain